MIGILILVGLMVIIYQVLHKPARHDLAAAFGGKVVWVTGASSGIGESLVYALYDSGARVIASARSVNELQRVRDACAKRPKKAGVATTAPHVLPLDLSKLDELPAKTKEALGVFGGIDVLINNGGISTRGAAIETASSVDMQLMSVNYFSAVALTKAVLPHMTEKRSGKIVVVSSIQGLLGVGYRAAYAASKHALHGFFTSLRYEVADRGVRVIIACPGYVATNLSLNALTADGSKYNRMDATTATGLSAETTADDILQATVRNDLMTLVCDLKTRIGLWLNFYLPEVLYSIMLKRAKQESRDRAAADAAGRQAAGGKKEGKDA